MTTFEIGGLRASFPLEEGVTPLVVEGHVSILTQYALSIREENEESAWYHEVELPRAHARLDATYEHAAARVVFEAVRSAPGGSLLGVAGDSVVFRLREGWAGYAAWGVVEARAGMIPSLTIGPAEQLTGVRVVTPTVFERTGFWSPADLGASARGILPRGLGWVGVAAQNGEGYAQRELNRGKNVEIAAALHPLATVRGVEPLTLLGSYTSGSSGVGLVRSDRVSASVGWEGEAFRAGASFAWAWGVDDADDRQSWVVGGSVRVRPLPWLEAVVDASHLRRDVEAESNEVTTITGAVGAFVVQPLGVFLAADGQLFGEEARLALPGRDDVRLRVIGAVEL